MIKLPLIVILSIIVISTVPTSAKKKGSVIVINNTGGTGSKGCPSSDDPDGGAATTVVKTGKKGNTIIIKGGGSGKKKAKKMIEAIPYPVPVPVHMPTHGHGGHNFHQESKVAPVFVPQEQGMTSAASSSAVTIADPIQRRYDTSPTALHNYMMQAQAHQIQRMNSAAKLNEIKSEVESRANPLMRESPTHPYMSPPPIPEFHHPFQGMQHHQQQHLMSQGHHAMAAQHHQHHGQPYAMASQQHSVHSVPSSSPNVRLTVHPVYQPVDPSEQFFRPPSDGINIPGIGHPGPYDPSGSGIWSEMTGPTSDFYSGPSSSEFW